MLHVPRYTKRYAKKHKKRKKTYKKHTKKQKKTSHGAYIVHIHLTSETCLLTYLFTVNTLIYSQTYKKKQKNNTLHGA